MRKIDEENALTAQFPSSNFPQLKRDAQGRFVLAFDASTPETCHFEFIAPQDLTAPFEAVVQYKMASGTSGGVAFELALEAITPGDAVDLDAGTSFASANAGTDAAVPGTAGHMDVVPVTLTNDDGIAPGDRVRISLTRATGNAADTASGDCEFLGLEIRDSKA